MVLYVPKNGEGPKDPARVCVIGEPGVGKTKLASTFPDSYFIDLEKGAGSTHRPRFVVETAPGASKIVLDELKRLKGFKFENGALLHPQFKIGTVVIDSIDAFQDFEKFFGVLRGKTKMQLQDWDTLYNVVFPVVLAWQALPVPVVVIAHIKQVEGEENKPGTKGFSLQGSFKDKLPRWFDYIIHLVAGPEGERYAITQPMISKGYKYIAKDRHGTLDSLVNKNKYIDVPAKDGFPSTTIADTIVKAHTSG